MVDRARHALQKAQWYLRNRERIRSNYDPEVKRAQNLVRKYQLTPEQYDLILWHQGGVCAICRKPPKESKRLNVDHSHSTGKVRGLLCHRCNNRLVAAIEDANFGAALEYVRTRGT